MESIGRFDESPGISEDFHYWLRAALAGFRFARNDQPLAWYRRRNASVSADGVSALRRALLACHRIRPAFGSRPELRMLDERVAYFEAELDAALARQALSSGDMPAVADALSALYRRRPSIRTAVAAWLARHAAPVLAVLYHLRLRTRHLIRQPAGQA
jgi:hypothetical protein